MGILTAFEHCSTTLFNSGCSKAVGTPLIMLSDSVTMTHLTARPLL